MLCKMRLLPIIVLASLALAACGGEPEGPTPEQAFLSDLTDRGVVIEPDAADEMVDSARLICQARADGVNDTTIHAAVAAATGRPAIADEMLAASAALC